jgi:hypothetical protein
MKAKILIVLGFAGICMSQGLSNPYLNTASQQSSDAPSCGTVWNRKTVYHEGETISFKATNFIANYWNQGKSPLTYSGLPGSGEPWKATGLCRPGAV